jgi:predicted TIM-barrel fold metal-dependent hydrolase
MIVDAHYHLFWDGSDPMSFLMGAARVGARRFSKTTPEPLDAKQLLEIQLPMLADQSGDKLVQMMDDAGIDKTILLPLDYWHWWETSGHPGSYDILKKNQTYLEATKDHEGRLYSLFGIDPRRKNAVTAFEKAMRNWGMKGLKLQPTARFYPDDPVCNPLYIIATELRVPVVIHSGNQPAPMAAKYSQPKYIDTVAADFPDLKIVIAHIGHGWWRETLDLASMKPNIYVDFSGWQGIYQIHPAYFTEVLRSAIDTLGPWRVLFGSDGALLNVIMPLSEWVSTIRNLRTARDTKFSPEELDVVMGKAAEHLFHL